jgi:hypothetical protein
LQTFWSPHAALKQEPKEDSNTTTAANSTPKYGGKAHWCVKSYLEYQGQKFLPRFDPVTYVKLTEQMDSHDIARGRGEEEGSDSDIPTVLARVEIPVLIMGIDSDVLYPLNEQEDLVKYLPRGKLCIIHSDDGHDGFLLEQDQMSRHITDFLKYYQKRLEQIRRREAIEKKKQKAAAAAVISPQQTKAKDVACSSLQASLRRGNHISYRCGFNFATAGTVNSV